MTSSDEQDERASESLRSEVFFVLDDFEGDLWQLSRSHHVWLVKSAHNTALAEEVWRRDASDYSPSFGVTTFDSSGDRLADFYSFLSTIDGHHDAHAAEEPWSVIHVLGVPQEDVDEPRVVDELGDVRIVAEAGGFAILRPGA